MDPDDVANMLRRRIVELAEDLLNLGIVSADTLARTSVENNSIPYAKLALKHGANSTTMLRALLLEHQATDERAWIAIMALKHNADACVVKEMLEDANRRGIANAAYVAMLMGFHANRTDVTKIALDFGARPDNKAIEKLRELKHDNMIVFLRKVGAM